jgi:hypothetical protein
MPLLHCAWFLVRVGVLCCVVVGEDPRTTFLNYARPHRCAWLPCARERALGIVVGGDPRTPLLRCNRLRRCALLSSARGHAVVRVCASFICAVFVCVCCNISLSFSLSLPFSLSISLHLHLSFLCYSHTCQHSAISMRRRIMLSYSKFTGVRRFAPAVPKEQPHRVVVVVGGLPCCVVRWRSACRILNTIKQTMLVSVCTYI